MRPERAKETPRSISFALQHLDAAASRLMITSIECLKPDPTWYKPITQAQD
jgi:hypothetical protein